MFSLVLGAFIGKAARALFLIVIKESSADCHSNLPMPDHVEHSLRLAFIRLPCPREETQMPRSRKEF